MVTTPPCTILVVDDEQPIRALLTEALSQIGHDVITAESGDRAMSMVAGPTRIDLIITDIIMPGEINGFELIERAKALRPGVPAIAMSGYVAKHGDKIRVADIFLQKPFTVAALDRTIKSLVMQVSC